MFKYLLKNRIIIMCNLFVNKNKITYICLNNYYVYFLLTKKRITFICLNMYYVYMLNISKNRITFIYLNNY